MWEELKNKKILETHFECGFESPLIHKFNNRPIVIRYFKNIKYLRSYIKFHHAFYEAISEAKPKKFNIRKQGIPSVYKTNKGYFLCEEFVHSISAYDVERLKKDWHGHQKNLRDESFEFMKQLIDSGVSFKTFYKNYDKARKELSKIITKIMKKNQVKHISLLDYKYENLLISGYDPITNKVTFSIIDYFTKGTLGFS
ncbi:MAG: hypothetical protein V1824_04185 [archaeon]